jgi:hypothetical protein
MCMLLLQKVDVVVDMLIIKYKFGTDEDGTEEGWNVGVRELMRPYVDGDDFIRH